VDPKDRLPGEFSELDVRGMLERLVAADVDFVVIGGIAVVLHGFPRLTRDLDIAFAFNSENLEALGEALVDLGARLRGVEEEVDFIPDARTLQGIELLTLQTEAGWLDIHRLPQGVDCYQALKDRAERVDLDGLSILLASPDDLIAMKRAAGRAIDTTDIAALESIKRLRAR
jgi:predicted nucleotidyltransferase